MKNRLIKLLGGYTADEYEEIDIKNAALEALYKYTSQELKTEYQRAKVFENFFLDTIQGKNRDERGKFTTRDSLKEYFAWCKIYGQMPHKKLTNAFMRYEASLSKVKGVKRTSEA